MRRGAAADAQSPLISVNTQPLPHKASPPGVVLVPRAKGQDRGYRSQVLPWAMHSLRPTGSRFASEKPRVHGAPEALEADQLPASARSTGAGTVRPTFP